MKDVLRGGKADNMPDSAFEKRELKKGMKHEREHTKNKALQKEIAKDHIVEDPKYYEHLDKVEKMAFAVGFEKVAVSVGWASKKVLGGLASRAGMKPGSVGHVRMGIEMDKKLKSSSDAALKVGKTEALRSMNRATKNNPDRAAYEVLHFGKDTLRRVFKK